MTDSTMISLQTTSVANRCPGAVPLRKPFARVVARPGRLVVSAEAEPEKKAGPKKEAGPVSGDYKKRLAEEYVGLGGAPNKPLPQNYFLWIIGVIGFLAVASYITGAI